MGESSWKLREWIMEDRILLVEDISAFLKVRPGTIHSREWQKRSGCPLIKHGRRLYAFEKAFMEWFKKGYVKSNG